MGKNMWRFMETAINMVVRERSRQTTVEGYTPAHDDEHTGGQLALLAAAYALQAGPMKEKRNRPLRNAQSSIIEFLEKSWGHEETDYDIFKPKDPIRDLVRAGALILAELERRLRAGEGFVSVTTKEDLDREGA